MAVTPKFQQDASFFQLLKCRIVSFFNFFFFLKVCGLKTGLGQSCLKGRVKWDSLTYSITLRIPVPSEPSSKAMEAKAFKSGA